VFVPVTDSNNRPLIPTKPSRARRWIRDGGGGAWSRIALCASGKATPFWDHGVFCVRLNVEPSGRETQPIVVGIDSGSKREGLTVKSAAHTFLNIQATAVDWVKDHMETRRDMRRARRFRKTPCRANRRNRARGGIPPSTKARWQWKLRLPRIKSGVARLYPIAAFVVEDVKAVTRGQRPWDVLFSPLQAGKEWLYGELRKIAPVHLKHGWETKALRDQAGLKKTRTKTAEVFAAHCVDSWVLANWYTGGHVQPDNTRLLCVTPLRFHRRQLHRLQPEKGGNRRPYGGTRSHGFKRGSLVKHPKLGLTYIGGWLEDRVSLHCVASGKRLTQQAKPSDCCFLSFNTWRTRLLPGLKTGVSAA